MKVNKKGMQHENGFKHTKQNFYKMCVKFENILPMNFLVTIN